MKLKKMIKVMQHFADGGEVECTETGFDDWEVAKHPCWNWSDYTYRIQGQKQKVTIEKWLCRDKDGNFIIIEMSYIGEFEHYEKVKLIKSYEVEL